MASDPIIRQMQAEIADLQERLAAAEKSCRHCGQEEGCKPDCAVEVMARENDELRTRLAEAETEIARLREGIVQARKHLATALDAYDALTPAPIAKQEDKSDD